MPSISLAPAHVLVLVFQHGSHGHASDFEVLRNALKHQWAVSSDVSCMPLEIWTTPVNEGLSTDDGLVACGERLASELMLALCGIAGRYPGATLHFSCVAHSFGGVIIRHALAKLDQSNEFAGIILETFMTLATPHVGALQMNASLRLGARALGTVFSTTYQDLLLDNTALDELCTAEALAPLGRFRRRVLYTCACKDFLVKFETGALVVLPGGVDVQLLPPPVEGHPHVRQALSLMPFDTDGLEERVIPLSRGEPSQLLEAARWRRCAPAFEGLDDPDGKRAERSAQMLEALRSVGCWLLHVVEFPEFYIQNGHGAIICHPNRLKNVSGAGGDVAEHVAKDLCKAAQESCKAADEMLQPSLELQSKPARSSDTSTCWCCSPAALYSAVSAPCKRSSLK